MKTKNLNEVYMREVIDKKITILKNDELDCYITFKEIKKMSSKCSVFINGERKTIVDNNYTIMEYSPINKKYNVRVFIDELGNINQYYFDIINNSYIKENQIFYEDLYLDVIYYTSFSTGNSPFISLVDEIDLINALSAREITDEEYNKAYKEAIDLMKELKDNKNIFINRGVKDYLIFKK